MEKNLQQLFKNARYNPKSHLSGNIYRAIELKNSRIIRIKMFSYLGLGVLSLSGSVFSVIDLVKQSSQLGFYQYLSLAFSDSGVIATYWREYTLSLIDSLPIVSLALSFFLLFTLFISIRNISYQFKNKLLIA
jgi:hypothetical protein